MPRLDPQQPLSESIPALALFHLDAAISLLEEQRTGLNEAVHQARKNLKRLRALIRLVENVDRKALETVRRDISKAARGLSEFRDATALVECATDLGTYLVARKAGEMATPLREAVERRRDLLALEAPATARMIEPVIAACREAMRDIEDANFGRGSEAPEILAAGRRENHDRARKTLKDCHHGGEPDSFHDLRKCAQTTLFQAGYLAAAWPFAFDAEADEAKTLATVLGQEHDIEVLTILMQAEPHLFGAIADKDRLAELLMERRNALRHDGMKIADRLYGQKSRHEARRLEMLWALARKNAD